MTILFPEETMEHELISFFLSEHCGSTL